MGFSREICGETFRGFARPSLPWGRKVFTSLGASSEVRAFFSFALFFFFTFPLGDGLTCRKKFVDWTVKYRNNEKQQLSGKHCRA